MTPKMLIAGLNPSWQKTIFFQNFERGRVNRAETVTETASGKGINCARAAMIWGKVQPVVLQFLGGNTGELIRGVLEQEKIRHISVENEGNTRVCTTLISRTDYTMTEVIEPSPLITEEAVRNMKQAVREQIHDCDALAICGTYPPGVDDQFYADLAAVARAHGKFVLLDSFMNVCPVLKQGVDMLKINREELFELTDKMDTDGAIRKLMQEYSIRYLAITDGPETAYFSEGAGVWKIAVPKVEKPLNPIGSGDTCSAVTLSEIMCGSDPCSAFRSGLAAASANCLTPDPASFDKETAIKMMLNS